MKTIKETLELALEALTDSTVSPTAFTTWHEYQAARINRDLAITALRKALAQERSSDEQPAQQEPLTDEHIERIYHRYGGDMINCARAIERAAHRTWVGLTIEDKKEYIAQDFGGSRTDAMDWTEKRLKEKNSD